MNLVQVIGHTVKGCLISDAVLVNLLSHFTELGENRLLCQQHAERHMVVSVFAPGTQEIQSMQSLECQSNENNKKTHLKSLVLHSIMEVLKNIFRFIGKHLAVSSCAHENLNPSMSPSSVIV